MFTDRLRLITPLAALLVLLLAAACSDSDTEKSPAPTPDSTKVTLTGRITVFAAASLTDAFNEIGTAFKAANPRAEVAFNFAGSQALRTQLEQGARADVFASADTVQMGNAVTSGAVNDAGKIFVHNSLVVITPTGSSGGVNTLADLARPGVKLVLAASTVPAGNYSRRALTNMEKDPDYGAGFSTRVLKNLVSEQTDVKQVVAQVALGQADAGIVYSTDAQASIGQLKRIDIPTTFNVFADYPIAIVKGTGNAATAHGFIDFVVSKDGQAILKKYGFVTLDRGS